LVPFWRTALSARNIAALLSAPGQDEPLFPPFLYPRRHFLKMATFSLSDQGTPLAVTYSGVDIPRIDRFYLLPLPVLLGESRSDASRHRVRRYLRLGLAVSSFPLGPEKLRGRFLIQYRFSWLPSFIFLCICILNPSYGPLLFFAVRVLCLRLSASGVRTNAPCFRATSLSYPRPRYSGTFCSFPLL